MCKDSANRVKYQRNIVFSLYFRGAAYLRDISLKDNGTLSHIHNFAVFLRTHNSFSFLFISSSKVQTSLTVIIQCLFHRTFYHLIHIPITIGHEEVTLPTFCGSLLLFVFFVFSNYLYYMAVLPIKEVINKNNIK